MRGYLLYVSMQVIYKDYYVFTVCEPEKPLPLLENIVDPREGCVCPVRYFFLIKEKIFVRFKVFWGKDVYEKIVPKTRYFNGFSGN